MALTELSSKNDNLFPEYAENKSGIDDPFSFTQQSQLIKTHGLVDLQVNGFAGVY